MSTLRPGPRRIGFGLGGALFPPGVLPMPLFTPKTVAVNTTAVHRDLLSVQLASVGANVVITLPGSPADSDYVAVRLESVNASTAYVVQVTGGTIDGSASPLELTRALEVVWLVYSAAAAEWQTVSHDVPELAELAALYAPMVATLHIYVSGAGSDANTGTEAIAPVQTLSRVWEIVPRVIDRAVVVHFIAPGTYAWTKPPRILAASEAASVTLLGESYDTTWGPFQTLAGTTASQLVLSSAAPAIDGGYVYVTSGPCAGYCKTIGEHDTVASPDVIKPVNTFGFPGADLSPGIGADVYGGVPNVVIDVTASVVADTVNLVEGQGAGSGYATFAFVQLAFTETSTYPDLVCSSANVRFYGVQFLNGILALIGGTFADLGIGDPALATPWLAGLGLTPADYYKWAGYGLTYPAYDANAWGLYVEHGSYARACGSFGRLAPAWHGPNGTIVTPAGQLELYGATAKFCDFGGANISQIVRDTAAPTADIPLKLGQVRVSQNAYLDLYYAFVAMTSAAPSIHTPAVSMADSNAFFRGPITVTSDSGGNSIGLTMSRGSQLRIVAGASLTVSGETGQRAVDLAESSLILLGTLTATSTGADCMRVANSQIDNKGSLSCTAAGGASIGLLVSGGRVAGETSTFLLSGAGGGLRATNGAQLACGGTVTCTATTDGDAAAFNSNAAGSFTGGAACTWTGGATGYGCNCVGGGRVAFAAQPTGVSGGAADLFDGGAGSPDTALAASFSALTNLANAIYRST